MKNSDSYKENEMAIAFQEGAEGAFDYFFRKWYPALCLYANKILNDRFEAEDIASGAFIKIWKKHSQFHQAQNIRSYLYRIVRNECFTHLKLQGRTLRMEEEIKHFTRSEFTPDIEKQIVAAEFLRELFQAFSDLPAQCSQVFNMLYKEGKTVKDIAKELELSESTVKTQKARGLLTLRKRFIPLS